MLDEIVISRAIIDRYFNKLMDNLQIDVAIAGGGPAGLTAAYYLAKRKVRVAVYEKIDGRNCIRNHSCCFSYLCLFFLNLF